MKHARALVIAALTAALVTAAGAADLYPPMQPPFTTWVENGQARAQIVTDDFPGPALTPATMLNRYLKKITGVALPVVAQPVAGRPVIYLGPKVGLGRLQPPPQLGSEGFAIVSQGPDLVIGGSNQLATLYGVSAFLEEYLGVRWFWDDVTGEVIPHTKTLRVGQINHSEQPSFAYRRVGAGNWALFNHMNVGTGQPDEFQTKWFVHTFLKLVPPDKYWKDHPEYYAMRGGVRQDPRDLSRQVQLCTSNPAVAQVVAHSIDEIMAQQPGLRMISVDPMDSQNFCQCPKCKAEDEPNAPYARQYSRRLVLFYNRVAALVAKKHPRLLIKSIAYHTYVAPPADPTLKLRDNVVIQFCRFEGHDHPLCDPTNPKDREFLAYYQGWRKITKHIIFYEYYYKASWDDLPWPIVHTLRVELPYLHTQGLMGVATQYTTNFATHGLDYYVAAKLLWNANINVDALLSDFYQKAFAEAAEPMRHYYERLERAAVEAGVNLAGQRPYPEMLAVFTPAVLADLDKDLQQAAEVVKDPQAKARVTFVARGLHYTHLVVDYLQTIANVRATLPQTPWATPPTGEMLQRVRQECGPKAEAIRAYLSEKSNRQALAGVNTYVDLLLKPALVLENWRADDSTTGDLVHLTKTAWLKQHPQKLVKSLPASFDLWVYGNDLDFVNGKPEHTIYIENGAGKEEVFGHVAEAGRPGDSINRAYILKGVTPQRLVKGNLRLVVLNDPGGPWASHFFAFYLMPHQPQISEDDATRKIETDLKWVRSHALGFVEYGYTGAANDDGQRLPVTIAAVGTPVGGG